MLNKIFETKHAEVAAAKTRVSVAQLEAQADAQPKPRGFAASLRNRPSVALIAEVKKASPSQGLIRVAFDPAEIARTYEESGAAALSVLTDFQYFQGAPENIRLARDAAGLPALRKDFIDDPYQVLEARAWGADAVLLIVAALDDAQLTDLAAYAHILGLDVLVEVHDDHELDRALKVGATLIGVNNRDLSTFKTDLSVSERLIPRIGSHATAVSESALETVADVERVVAAGAKAVLIGTSFCAAPDIQAKVREVMGWPK